MMGITRHMTFNTHDIQYPDLERTFFSRVLTSRISLTLGNCGNWARAKWGVKVRFAWLAEKKKTMPTP